MRYIIDKAITKAYPDFYRGVIIAQGVNNSAPMNEELYGLLLEKMNAILEDNAINAEHPKIAAWRAVYESFPAKNKKKIKPSVHTLIERIKKGNKIPFISPLVCISNLVSLQFYNPGGLVDADKIQGNPSLGFAKGTENFLPFGAESEVSPEPGEIIFFDDKTNVVMCSAWNSRGGQATMVTSSTTNTIIDIDTFGHQPGSAEELNQSIAFARQLIEKYCGASTISFVLGKDLVEMPLPFRQC